MNNRFLHLDWRVFLFGGNSNNTGKAGFWAVNCNNAFSNANSNIGSHLYLLMNKIIIKCKDLASWQNIKQCLIHFSSADSYRYRKIGGEISKTMKRKGFLYKKEIPFLTTVRKINKYYSLT